MEMLSAMLQWMQCREDVDQRMPEEQEINRQSMNRARPSSQGTELQLNGNCLTPGINFLGGDAQWDDLNANRNLHPSFVRCPAMNRITQSPLSGTSSSLTNAWLDLVNNLKAGDEFEGCVSS